MYAGAFDMGEDVVKFAFSESIYVESEYRECAMLLVEVCFVSSYEVQLCGSYSVRVFV